MEIMVDREWYKLGKSRIYWNIGQIGINFKLFYIQWKDIFTESKAQQWVQEWPPVMP